MSEKLYQFPSGASQISERKPDDAVKFPLALERLDDNNFRAHLLGQTERRSFWITHVRGKRILAWPGGSVELDALDAAEATANISGKLRPLKLTMPGKVLAIKTAVGDNVQAGQALVIVEAMKMENILMAPASAKVSKVHVSVGDRLEAGTILVSFETT